MKPWWRIVFLTAFALLATATAVAQNSKSDSDPARAVRRYFLYVNRKLLAMAKDFPAEKYSYRMEPEMRSFAEVLVHAASGNIYAVRVARGENAKWDEINPRNFPDKASVVALLETSINEATEAMGKVPREPLERQVEPWVEVMEHSAEHYGLLVAYYRANGLVPPASRKDGQ